MRKHLVKESLSNIFKRFKIENINLSTSAAGVVISYTNWDSEAAWQMYVELLTRIATQPLSEKDGDEETALESIYSLFPITRNILREYGRNAINFTRISVIILNQKIRPFTAKWHRLFRQNAFKDPSKCEEFRAELEQLRHVLIAYTRLLAEMAKVEDLTCLENDEIKS